MAEVFPSCENCGGSGVVGVELCVFCMGDGTLPLRGEKLYLRNYHLEVLAKIQEVKIKINQMQADINYIKARLAKKEVS